MITSTVKLHLVHMYRCTSKGDSLLNPRTSGEMHPTGNEQGGHYFLSLHSGKRINRFAWTELPMPNEVVKQIHRLAVTDRYESIMFADTEGKILQDQMEANDDTEMPIAGMGEDDMGNTMQHENSQYDSVSNTDATAEEPGNNNHSEDKPTMADNIDKRTTTINMNQTQGDTAVDIKTMGQMMMMQQE